MIDGTGSNARLSLVAGGSVSGTLVDDATGLPIAKARINVSPKPGSGPALPAAGSQTDAEGRFVVRGLGTGAYVVHVWPPNGIQFQEPIELASGESRVLDLRQQAPGAIQIVVLDQDGAPVAGVRPTVSGVSGGQVWPNWNALMKEGVKFGPNTWQELLNTDAQGLNLRRHVPPGEYTVKVAHGGYSPSEAIPVTVRAGRTAEVELVIERTSNPGG